MTTRQAKVYGEYNVVLTFLSHIRLLMRYTWLLPFTSTNARISSHYVGLVMWCWHSFGGEDKISIPSRSQERVQQYLAATDGQWRPELDSLRCVTGQPRAYHPFGRGLTDENYQKKQLEWYGGYVAAVAHGSWLQRLSATINFFLWEAIVIYRETLWCGFGQRRQNTDAGGA